MEQPQSRFHGKMRVQRGDTTVEVNIFDENRDVVYLELKQALDQFSNDRMPGADWPIAPTTPAPTTPEPARTAAAPSPVPKPTATGTKAANAPVCDECDLADMVELVTWADKKTGERKKAWKCQRCKKWLYVS